MGLGKGRIGPGAVVLGVLAAGCASPAGSGPAPAGPCRMEADPAFLRPGDLRTFSVTYDAVVKDIPAGTKRLRVWVPVPRDTAVQSIVDLSFRGSAVPALTTEKRHGNRLAFYEVEDPASRLALAPEAKTFTWEASMSFTCARREQVTDLSLLQEDGAETDPAAAHFLRGDRMAPVTDATRKMADEAVKGKTTTLAKARAIYDAVAAKMTYDKSGTGWGKGDVRYACEVGKGNCTDFHALFMSMCHAEGIAAGFEIGLYAPYGRHSDEKPGGYHCWSFFRVPGKAWVPVDISEADRDPSRMDYFFGAHTNNRVTLSVGRDLVLEPAQAGEPVNFLLNPYAEADGKPVPTEKTWSMQDRD